MVEEDTKASRHVPEQLGEEIGGHGRVYFDDVVIDNILDAILELSATVYAHRDRVTVLEKVLAERGIDVTDSIETYIPNEAELVSRSDIRNHFIERIFGAFLRRPTNDLGLAADLRKD